MKEEELTLRNEDSNSKEACDSCNINDDECGSKKPNNKGGLLAIDEVVHAIAAELSQGPAKDLKARTRLMQILENYDASLQVKHNVYIIIYYDYWLQCALCYYVYHFGLYLLNITISIHLLHLYGHMIYAVLVL